MRDLFRRENVIGVFRGFREGGLEFQAELVLPYRNEFQNIPMHGQFILVQLETPEEAVLGRIATFSSEGKLTTSAGEEFNIRAVQEGRSIPEDLREQYLRSGSASECSGSFASTPTTTFSSYLPSGGCPMSVARSPSRTTRCCERSPATGKKTA